MSEGIGRAGFVLDHSGANQGEAAINKVYSMERKQLGVGTYGSVCKAVHKNTRVVRAVKTIQKRSVKNLEQFRQEIAIMKEMDHPNIIKLYETFEDRSNIYLVLELCKGGELFDRIADLGQGMSEKIAAGMLKQMLSALFYMHKGGVMHRDLKPENFLLLGPDEDTPLKVIDFGLATHFKPGDTKSTRAGTPYYVAPQVLKGKYNEKADIWSLGVIAYVLLCGFPPFYGDSDAEILSMVKSGQFKYPSPEWDDISKEAKDLINNMLVKDEPKRFSAEQSLNHPWILNYATMKQTMTPDMGKKVVSNFKNFRAQSRLKKVAMTLIAQHLQEKEIEDLKAMFLQADDNNDGTLTFEEIKKIMKDMEKSGGNTGWSDDMEQVMRDIDSDKSGVIEYTEFLAATMDRKQYIKRETCWQAFQVFDLDNDGVITREELQKVLGGDGMDNICSKEIVEEMIKEVDLNGDGSVDFDEFMQMMTSKTGFLKAPPGK